MEKNAKIVNNRFVSSDMSKTDALDYIYSVSTYSGIVVVVDNNKLDTINSNGFKKWLSQNPITLQYQLTTESVKTVDLTPLKKPYEETNHYHLTSNIPCEAILEVPVVSTGEQTLQDINN